MCLLIDLVNCTILWAVAVYACGGADHNIGRIKSAMWEKRQLSPDCSNFAESIHDGGAQSIWCLPPSESTDTQFSILHTVP